MMLGPRAFLRVSGLVLLAVVLQTSGVADMRVLGGHPDLIALTVVGVAFFAGSVPGAVTGFMAGLLLDVAVGQNVGLSSLVGTAVGYAIGRYREVRDPAHGLAAIPVGAAGTAGFVAGFAGVSFMLEVDASVSLLIFRDMLVTVAINALLALPAFALVRRVLRPVLLADPLAARRRRRRPAATGTIGVRGIGVR